MSSSPIVRAHNAGAKMLDVIMSDGLEFATANIHATDAELKAEADEVRLFLADMVGSNDNEDLDYDEDPDADGHGWERRALNSIAAA